MSQPEQTNIYAIELHAVYDRPGKHALFGLFHGTARDCRAKLRELREQYAEDLRGRGSIHMRWLKPVPAEALAMDPPPAPLCWMTASGQADDVRVEGWVSAEDLEAGMEA